MIDELAEEQKDKAVVGKVNVGIHSDLAKKYGIAGVPTILVFKDVEVVDKKMGMTPKPALQELIDKHA